MSNKLLCGQADYRVTLAEYITLHMNGVTTRSSDATCKLYQSVSLLAGCFARSLSGLRHWSNNSKKLTQNFFLSLYSTLWFGFHSLSNSDCCFNSAYHIEMFHTWHIFEQNLEFPVMHKISKLFICWHNILIITRFHIKAVINIWAV